MMYTSAVEQIKGSAAAAAKKNSSESLIPIFRLGKVSSLSNGRAYVQFYGESSASGKLYPYLEGYKPAVNDDVLLCQQGSTFIIAGKISKDNIVDNYYLLKSAADALYLTQAAADDRYELKGQAVVSEIRNSKYGLKFDSTTSNDIVPANYDSSTGAVNLGTTSKKLGTGCFTTLGGSSSANAIQNAYIKSLTLYDKVGGDIIPSSNNSYDLGSSSYRYKKIYATDLSVSNNFVFSAWKPNDTQTFTLSASVTNANVATFTPSNSTAKWGTSTNKWAEGYFTDLYASTLSGLSTLGGASSSTALATLNVKDVNLYGDIVPDTTNARSLGSSSKKFKNIYTEALDISTLVASTWKFYVNGSTVYSIQGSALSGSAGGLLAPSVTNKIALGSSSLKYSNIYATTGNFDTGNIATLSGVTTLGGDSSNNSVTNAYIKALKLYGNITASANNTHNIGAKATNFASGYINNIYTSKIYYGFGTSTPNLNLNGSLQNPSITPNLNSTYDIGSSSYQFRNCYAKQFYQNGTAISTSDRRKKTGIKRITQKYVDFFRRLCPRLFKFKDGESGRLHSGFIAQEVEEAAHGSGIDNKDLAFLCIDENGDYGLRYEELIAIQTKVIQDLMDKVERLEDRVEDLERIVKGGSR